MSRHAFAAGFVLALSVHAWAQLSRDERIAINALTRREAEVVLPGGEATLICRLKDVSLEEVADAGIAKFGRRVVVTSDERRTSRLKESLGGRGEYAYVARVGYLDADGGRLYLSTCGQAQTHGLAVGGRYELHECPYLLPDGGEFCASPGLGVAEVPSRCVRQRCSPDGGFRGGACLRGGASYELPGFCAGNVFSRAESSGPGCEPAPCVVEDGVPEP
ncbi:MAG: hypothetical protein SFW67_35510 [Myxococcaceae bacterium]|nr:hypothetical protein [Myxococcaceae bacterium]